MGGVDVVHGYSETVVVGVDVVHGDSETVMYMMGGGEVEDYYRQEPRPFASP